MPVKKLGKFFVNPVLGLILFLSFLWRGVLRVMQAATYLVWHPCPVAANQHRQAAFHHFTSKEGRKGGDVALIQTYYLWLRTPSFLVPATFLLVPFKRIRVILCDPRFPPLFFSLGCRVQQQSTAIAGRRSNNVGHEATREKKTQRRTMERNSAPPPPPAFETAALPEAKCPRYSSRASGNSASAVL